MKVLRIRCHCGRNLADCQRHHPDGRYSVDGGRAVFPAERRVRPAYPSEMASPSGHPNLIVVPRDGVSQRHHQPGGQVITYTWTCPDCGRAPSLRGERVGELYGKHRSEPRRVVHIAFGTDV